MIYTPECEDCGKLVDDVEECVWEYLDHPGEEVSMVRLDLLYTLVRFAYRVRAGRCTHGWASDILNELLTAYKQNVYGTYTSHVRRMAYNCEKWFPVEYPWHVHMLERVLKNEAPMVIYPGLPEDEIMSYMQCLNLELIKELYGETDQEDEK